MLPALPLHRHPLSLVGMPGRATSAVSDNGPTDGLEELAGPLSEIRTSSSVTSIYGADGDVVSVFQACRNGHAKVVKAALDSGKVDIGDLDLKGDTLLHAAASQGQKKIARDLLKRGADIHARNFAGKACYELAHEFNYWELGDYLREKVGLEKIGPSNWKGEPGADALEGMMDDESVRKLMERREHEKKLSAAFEKLEDVDMALVVDAIQSGEAVGAIRDKIECIRESLGDAARVRLLEGVLHRVWKRSKVLVLDCDDGDVHDELQRLERRTRGSDIEGLADEVEELEEARNNLDGRILAVEELLEKEKFEKQAAEDRLRELANEGPEFETKKPEVLRGASERLHEGEGKDRLMRAIGGIAVPGVTRGEREEVEEALRGEGALAVLTELCNRGRAELERRLEEAQEARRETAKAQGMLQKLQIASLEREEELQARIRQLKEELVGASWGVEGSGEEASVKAMLDARDAAHAEQLERVSEELRTEVARARNEAAKEVEKAREKAERQVEEERRRWEDGQYAATRVDRTKSIEMERELDDYRREHASVLSRLREAQKDARDARRDADLLQKQQKSGKMHGAASAILSFGHRLVEMKKELALLKDDVASSVASCVDLASVARSELLNFCMLISPLSHETPARLRAEKLSREQLASGLRHMMGKYRGALDDARAARLALLDARGGVMVLCRVRGMQGEEHRGGGTCVHARGGGRLAVLQRGGGVHEFAFDSVVRDGEDHERAFEDGWETIRSCMDGRSVGVYAYGAEGAGKEHTMVGDPPGIGLWSQSIEALFKVKRERSVVCDTDVRVSMYQLSGDGDSVMDLLLPGGDRVVTVSKDGKSVTGLSEHSVDTSKKALALVKHGLSNRCSNGWESESKHVVMRVGIRTCARGVFHKSSAEAEVSEHAGGGKGAKRHLAQGGRHGSGGFIVTASSTKRRKSTMHMHDLAEEAQLAGAFPSDSVVQGSLTMVLLASPDSLKVRGSREGLGIVSALESLQRMISNKAVEAGRIASRGSVLTRLLADSALKPGSKSIVYAFVSPCIDCVKSTLSTLKYASDCRGGQSSSHAAALHKVGWTTLPSHDLGHCSEQQQQALNDAEHRAHHQFQAAEGLGDWGARVGNEITGGGVGSGEEFARMRRQLEVMSRLLEAGDAFTSEIWDIMRQRGALATFPTYFNGRGFGISIRSSNLDRRKGVYAELIDAVRVELEVQEAVYGKLHARGGDASKDDMHSMQAQERAENRSLSVPPLVEHILGPEKGPLAIRGRKTKLPIVGRGSRQHHMNP